MNYHFFTDYPSWFWLLCIACGALYAAGLYFRERKIKAAIKATWIMRFLTCIRFATVTIIAFFLLQPYLKSRFNEIEKPIIILAQDNSSSIVQGIKDSAAYIHTIQQLSEDLSKKYDVKNYTFGESLHDGLHINFKDKSTDISSAMSEIQSLYQNLNVGAIIIASDGIYNTGSNPVYIKNDLAAPVYTIALGDTIPKKDLRITRVLNNKIVYLKDKFTIACDIEAIHCNGLTCKISVTELLKGNTKIGDEKSIPVSADVFHTTASWELSATNPGIRHYQIKINSVDGEITTDNNIQDVYIEVLDARQKILLLANAPHPDIAAIRSCIESNENYTVDAQLATEFKGTIGDYNLVILHNLPSTTNQVKNITDALKQKNIPVLYITGSQTALSMFNSVQSLLKITSSGQSPNEVTGSVESAFNLFTLSDKSISTYPVLPAVNAPYGQYAVSPASQIVLYQKIGSVSTKYPLLIFSLPGSEKCAILCAENFWKWHLYDFVLNKNQNATNELISKTVQYLAAKNDKKQFSVTSAKNVFNETESVIIDAELYNDSYELINDPDAVLSIKNDADKTFNFQFNKVSKSYTLNAGYFPEGNYTYSASATYNGKELHDNGAFSISPVRLEAINTTANYMILNKMAVQSSGKMVYENQIQTLNDLIEQNGTAKPVMHEIVKTDSAINLRWVFFLLLALLAAEWFIRKINGTY